MFSLVRRTAVAAVVVGASLAAYAPASQAALFTDRGLWETSAGTFADVDIAGQVPAFAAFPSGSILNLPFGDTMTFDANLEGRSVPSGGWATWSGGNTPAILYSLEVDTMTATFSGAITAFGLEMQPDPFAIFDMTLTLSDASVITQSVDGNGGALFFGWTGQSITSMTMSCGDANEPCLFAIGRMVQGQEQVAAVAEPATLALFGLGLAGLAFARRRKIA